ncbi:MAG: PAS domain S-box protein [Devosia sp.]
MIQTDIEPAQLADLERYRLLVDAIADYAIYMLDVSGHVASWNAGARRFKGYADEEILGRHFSQFYTPEDRETGLPQRALATAANEGRFEAEGWRVRKDGSRLWAHVVIDPIRDAKGELIGFAKITRDISERRQAQLALQEAREQLFQAQKMEAIGQLTGGIAHDFNNLLTAIQSSLELLKKRMPDDPGLTKLLDNAMQGTQRGAALTQRMLAFARRQNLEVEAVDLRALVSGMSDLLQRALGAQIGIETEFPDKPLLALTDPNQLEAAILNLAVNARDALEGAGTITLGGRAQTRISEGRERGEVCLSVSDNGPGMSEETLARATEPFFTTKGVGKGTGLGLSMVQGVAEQSGGRLELSSPKGGGVRAEIWLPAADASQLAAATAEPAPGADTGGARRLTVVAVDDDALVLLNTVALLEDLGHRVFEAYSASEALDIVRREAVDLVITDFAMPGTDGAQLAAAIRAEKPDLPIILASGYAELPAGSRLNLPRLAKPFMQTDLARAIAAVA